VKLKDKKMIRGGLRSYISHTGLDTCIQNRNARTPRYPYVYIYLWPTLKQVNVGRP